MSGLLQRLARQALIGKSPTIEARVRPAMNVHAQVPVTEGSQSPSVESPQGPGLTSEPAFTVATKRREASSPRGPDSNALNSVSARPLEATVNAPPKIIPWTPTSVHERVIHEVTREILVPGRLMPETPAQSAKPIEISLPSNTRQSPYRNTDDGRESTEVHVHIGRIEVVAGSEPAPPKKVRRPAPRETRPLSEYLAGGKHA